MNQLCTRTLSLILFGLLSVTTALAQFTVSGSVKDATGESLIGVSILAKGTAIGTISDFDGNYSLSVPDGTKLLIFSYIGFADQEREVNSSTGRLDVVMSDASTVLDEVVITGLATSVKRGNLANSVESISSAELTGITVATTTDAALYGKFKGVEIKANSGAPGGGISVKLRGNTSIGGSSQPLVIMDGVYIDNSSIPAGLNVVSAAASGGSTSNQDNPSNRLADIDPEDIETIEILKGASAAAQYGSRASGGVIIITTKRGQAGKTKVQYGQTLGWTEMLNPLGQREWTEDKVLNKSNFASSIDAFRAGPINDYEDLLYGNKGLLSTSRLSISGGNDKTSFFLGGTYKNEDGIVRNTGYDKASIRLNLDHKLTNWLDLSTTTSFVNSSADRGFFNNDNSGTTMGISFVSTPSFAQLEADENGIFPDNPYAPSNFLETAEKITNNEKVNRIIAGGSATAKLFSNEQNNLKFIFRGGIDYYNLATTALFPNDVQFQRNGAGLNGVSVQGSTNNFISNIAAFLVHTYYTSSGITFRTQAGVTREKFDQNTILGTASNMIGLQTNLDQSGTRNVNQTRGIQEDKGFFAQEEFNLDDKFLLTVGLRGDKSSNNSDVNKLYYYPKASTAINLHEFGFLDNSPLSQFKVRAAYGQSGNFPNRNSKFTSFNSFIVDGRPGILIGTTKGNDEVGPERQSEIELGFDLGLLKNKVLFDFTYYIKSVEDLLLDASLQPSSGFNTGVVNAAELENKGFEIGLNANIIQSSTLNWFTRISWWKNKGEVTKLDVPAYTDGGFADFLGNYLIKEGFSPTTIIGVGPDPTVTLNGDGPATLQIFGNAEPDFQTSFYNQLSFGDFDFTFLIHWKKVVITSTYPVCFSI
jgi:TonB-dependent starch-binding outer membrane protein SusC